MTADNLDSVNEPIPDNETGMDIDQPLPTSEVRHVLPIPMALGNEG